MNNIFQLPHFFQEKVDDEKNGGDPVYTNTKRRTNTLLGLSAIQLEEELRQNLQKTIQIHKELQVKKIGEIRGLLIRTSFFSNVDFCQTGSALKVVESWYYSLKCFGYGNIRSKTEKGKYKDIFGLLGDILIVFYTFEPNGYSPKEKKESQEDFTKRSKGYDEMVEKRSDQIGELLNKRLDACISRMKEIIEQEAM